MSHSAVIVNRAANHDVPDAYIQLALEKNPTAWGAAAVVDGAIQVNAGNEMTVDLFKASLEEFKDSAISFYFCNSPSAIDMEDVSPHTILEDEEGNPLLVAMVEGEFPGFVRTMSPHPSSSFFVKDYLIPKISELAELAGDLDKIMEFLEKPNYKRDCLAQAAPESNATITLICSNGKALTYHQGKDAAEYTWGWVNHNYGYALAKEVEPAQAKKKSIFPSKSTVREAAPVANKGVIDKPVKTEGATVIKNSSTPNLPEGYSTKKMRPVDHLSRKDLKRWYQRRIGYAPKGWEDYCTIFTLVDSKGNEVLVEDLKRLGLTQVVLTQLGNPPRSQSKDTDTEHIEGGEKPTGPPVSPGEILPIMSPAAKEFANKFLMSSQTKKIIAENGEKLKDPREIKAVEERVAAFPVQAGVKSIDDCMPMPYSMMLEWGQKNFESMVNFTFSLQNIVLAQRETIATLREKITVKQTDDHVLAKEELKPEKKASIFPSKKAATG